MEITPEQAEALRIAQTLVEAGIPVFAAEPITGMPGQYHLPKGWDKTECDQRWRERWRPGWALAAVGGHAADFLDLDPRNGSAESVRELEAAGHVPRSFGRQRTPSGGTHDVISATGERKSTMFMPGVDLQSGAPDGQGRGFVWIAPTVRPSKDPLVGGALVAYRWEVEPEPELLAEWTGRDDSIEGVVSRIRAKRSVVHSRAQPQVNAVHGIVHSEMNDQLFARPSGLRTFTYDEAEKFCEPYLDELEKAPVGSIEESANVAAAALSHFVPAFWSADTAFTFLSYSLGRTAYDPDRAGAGWHAEKFQAVLDGRRPPLDNWKAVREVSAAEAAAAFGHAQTGTPLPATAEQAQDAVEALLGRMLTAEQLAALEPPEFLVEDVLDRDTLATMIGQPGSFKSFVALDIAAHVGSGQKWRGRRVHRGEVVYIVAEGARGMTLRTRAWSAKHERPMTGVRFLPEPVQVGDAVAWQVLIEACRRIEPVLVVIDTQAMVTVGMEENSNTEMGVAFKAFRRVREATGACVLLVHHTTKDGATTRGASAQDGAQDTRLKLVRQEPRSSLVVKLTNDKQKDMAEIEGGVTFAMESVDLGADPRNGRALSSLVLSERDVSAYDRLAGTGDGAEPASSVSIPEPEAWTYALVPDTGAEHIVRRQILQALAHLAGAGDGLTWEQVYGSVVERWYQERSATSRSKRGIDKQTWDRQCTALESLEVAGEYEPEPAVTKKGRRFKINPAVLEVTDE